MVGINQTDTQELRVASEHPREDVMCDVQVEGSRRRAAEWAEWVLGRGAGGLLGKDEGDRRRLVVLLLLFVEEE